LREQYDKVTLTYLANYYCGATADMKKLWKVLKEYAKQCPELDIQVITPQERYIREFLEWLKEKV